MSFSTTQLVGFGGQRRSSVASCNYVGQTQYATNTTSPSTSVNIGTAATGRYVIIVWSYYSLSSGTMSSPTIDGTSATIIAQTVSASGQAGCALIGAQVNTGGSVTVAATMSANAQIHEFDVFEAFNILSISGHQTMTDNSVSSTVLSGTLDIPANGILIAGTSCIDGTATSWTGPTEAYDTTYSSQQRSGAKDAYAAAQSAYTVSATTTSMGTRGALVAASFAPA